MKLLTKLTSLLLLERNKIVSRNFFKLRSVGAFFILGLLVFTLSTSWASIAFAQDPIRQLAEQITEKTPALTGNNSSEDIQAPQIQKPSVAVSNTIGDIVYAPVKLDGYKLFDVASQVVLDRDHKNGQEVSPIEKRVQRIENVLETIIKIGDRQNLEIKVGTLHGQTSLLASDQKVLNNKLIGTVTDLDAQLYGIAVPELAEEAAKRIERALKRAWYERDPQYLRKQFLIAIKIAAVMLVVSSVLILSQKYLKAQWRRVIESDRNNDWRDRSLISRWTTLWRTNRQPLRRSVTESITNSGLNPEGEYAAERDHLLNSQQQQSQWKQHRNRNFLLRRILAFGQIVILLFGIASILRLFPHTRELGLLLLGKPIIILTIWLIFNLCQKGSELFIEFSLENWAEEKSLIGDVSQRNSLRSSTLVMTFKRTTTAVLVLLGIYLSLDTLNIPISAMLAGAGILGFALSFAFQDLIKDLINGFRILWIDSFAVGDIIAIGDVAGLVEDLTLIYTQLRDLEGRLITIPNSEIRIVQNMTKDWSRVDFTIEIGYETDADRAIEIIQQVAEQMYSDWEWQKLIIEPPELLGIEQLAHSGMLIRLWRILTNY